MQFATKLACCMAQATRTTWRGDGPSTLTAPTTARQGCPEWACGTDTTLVQSPEHGLGFCCGAPGRVVPDVQMGPLPAPGAWQGKAGIQWKGTIRMMARRIGSSPHPSPGAYKRRIVKPSSLSRLPASHCLRLFDAPTSPLHLIVCMLLVCDRSSSGPVPSTRFHEPWQSD